MTHRHIGPQDSKRWADRPVGTGIPFLKTPYSLCRESEEPLAPGVGPVDSKPPWLLDSTALQGPRQGIGERLGQDLVFSLSIHCFLEVSLGSCTSAPARRDAVKRGQPLAQS